MKTIGILGGLGPQATMDFENKLHLAAQNLIPQKNNQGYPKIVTYYFRQAPMETDGSGKPLIPLKPKPELLTAAKQLGSISDFLVIPSNTPYFFKDAIEQASGKKLLSLVDLAIAEVQKRKVKKAGVLSIGITLKNKLYQSRLDELKIPWVTIEADMGQMLDAHIFKFMEGVITQEAHDCALNCLEYIKKEGAEITILGCSEIPLLLGKNYSSAPDIIDPVELLAEAAIKYSLS